MREGFIANASEGQLWRIPFEVAARVPAILAPGFHDNTRVAGAILSQGAKYNRPQGCECGAYLNTFQRAKPDADPAEAVRDGASLKRAIRGSTADVPPPAVP